MPPPNREPWVPPTSPRFSIATDSNGTRTRKERTQQRTGRRWPAERYQVEISKSRLRGGSLQKPKFAMHESPVCNHEFDHHRQVNEFHQQEQQRCPFGVRQWSNLQTWIQREIAEIKSKVFQPSPDGHQSDISTRRLEIPPQRIEHHPQARISRRQPDQQSFVWSEKKWM